MKNVKRTNNLSADQINKNIANCDEFLKEISSEFKRIAKTSCAPNRFLSFIPVIDIGLNSSALQPKVHTVLGAHTTCLLLNAQYKDGHQDDMSNIAYQCSEFILKLVTER